MQRRTSPVDRIAAATLSIEQIRSIDRIAVDQFGMNSLVLMENAALGSVTWLVERFGCSDDVQQSAPPNTAILCGTGNNGGDGLAIARHLRALGWECTVLFAGDVSRLSSDARCNLDVLVHADEGCDIRWPKSPDEITQALDGKELILDCLLGTGSTGAPRAPMDQFIQAANGSQAKRVAIDVPTGVNCETGERPGEAFKCDATLTFVARKPAMNLDPCRGCFGEIQVIPIGIPKALIEQVLNE